MQIQHVEHFCTPEHTELYAQISCYKLFLTMHWHWKEAVSKLTFSVDQSQGGVYSRRLAAAGQSNQKHVELVVALGTRSFR